MASLFADIGVELADLSSYTHSPATEFTSALFSADQDFDSLYGFNGHIASQLGLDKVLSKVVGGANLKGAVVDDPVFFPLTVQVLAERKIPVVSVIHNIESFLPRSLQVKAQWDLFQEEVDVVASSALCVTIAREDAWLLRNMGAECYNYPYFPSEENEAQLAKIRIARRKSKKKFCLCMGTAYNPPTLFGMKKLVNNWSTITGGNLPLVLAGYGVDRFFDRENVPKAVNVVGGVDDVRLEALLTECSVCVLHQDVGAGALTKIPELLRAGIPVVSSQHAARSYGGRDGVYEYQGMAEIPQLLMQVMQRDCAPPSLLKTDSNQLLNHVAGVFKL
ncbi:glycosyltransferase [Marinifilum sp. JC120]|nr:glycosyltransferase [Marinifilum sp. JC120]